MLFSELYKNMVNKVTFVGFRGDYLPNCPPGRYAYLTEGWMPEIQAIDRSKARSCIPLTDPISPDLFDKKPQGRFRTFATASHAAVPR